PGGPDDITGTDANGRYYIDIISFHYYPFNGTQTRAQVISKLTSAGSLKDNLVILNSRIANANTYHGRTGANALKTAITEANVNYKNSLTDNLSTMGANSFIGGQFVAEMLGVGMKNKVEIINIWSVVEGNSTEFNIGYIDKVTGNKKPLYHHFKLLADNFKGNYITATDNVTNVKTMASQNGTQIAVMIMNQELTGSLNYTLRLNTGTVTGTNPLKININAGIALQYSDVIVNQSSTLLVFNSSGVLIKKCEYSLANHAMLNIGPTCVDYLASPLPVTLLSFTAKLESQSRVVFDWATASQTNNDFFSIEKTTDGIHFETIAVVDGAGTSNQTLTYTTNDEQPSKGVSYYRLRQTDFDGQSEAFGMEEIRIGMEETEFVVYPNPFNGLDLSISITTHANNEKLRLVLYDVQGRKVWEKNHFFEESGSRTIEMDLSERLPAGMYFLNAVSGKQKFNQKLIVN
nr:T9SS type A sorting domain-containing protein [Bacteroidota bacterium]